MKKSQRKPVWYGRFFGCSCCGRMATWYYCPWHQGDDPKSHYFCDKCVSRGCSCQVDRDTGDVLLDKKGRDLPCIEFTEYPHGDPIVPAIPSRFRKRPPGDLRKFCDGPQRSDRRRWRSELRRWTKNPADWWWPHAVKRVRNDLVATRLMKQLYPVLIARQAERERVAATQQLN